MTERSEETLTTRDLAQPNEPADRGAVGDSTGDGAEEGSVYDHELVSQEEPGGSIPAGGQTGSGADETNRAGAVRPAGDDPAVAGRGDDLAVAGRGDEAAMPAGGDEAVPPPPTPAGSAGAAGSAATGTSDAGAAGAATADGGAAGAATTDAGAARAGTTGEAGESPTATASGDSTPLLSAEDSASFQRRWEEVQTRFVDEPRGAVQEADGLVANLMQQLAEGFAQERERLEAQWGRGEDISTEDLRVTLQRYRSFFQRLLAA